MASGGPCKQAVTLTIQTYEQYERRHCVHDCQSSAVSNNYLYLSNEALKKSVHTLMRSDHVQYKLPLYANGRCRQQYAMLR